MIELPGLGLIYGIGKDIWKYIKNRAEYEEDDKLVNNEWIEKSDFGRANKKTYNLRWTKQEKVESRRLEDYDILYEVNDREKKVYRIMNKTGSVLMGKKDSV